MAMPQQLGQISNVSTQLSIDPAPSLKTRSCSQDNLALWSSHLEDFFHRDRIRLHEREQSPESGLSSRSGSILPDLKASQVVLKRLAEWARPVSPEPSIDRQVLWLSGPYIHAIDMQNPLSILASSFLELADHTNVPVISHFCEVRRGEELRSGITSIELQALLALSYTLIRQVIEQLPENFDTASTLSAHRFQALDGTATSFSSSSELLETLLELLPHPILCVIDGLQRLDDRTTRLPLQKLIFTIVNSRNVRVLFTTTGRSACLSDELRREEQEQVNSEDAEWSVLRSESLLQHEHAENVRLA